MKIEYVLIMLAFPAAFAVVDARDGHSWIASDFSCGPVVVEINGGRENTEAFYTSRGVEIALRGGGRMLATELPKPVRKHLEQACHVAYENAQKQEAGGKVSQ